MRIGIDARCLGEGRRTGVEEYTLNLLNTLFRSDRKNEYVLFFNSFRPEKTDFSWINQYPNVTLRRFNFPNKLLNFFFWYCNWPKMDKMIGGVDLFFMPNIIFGGVSKKTKLLVTIHDLSFERYPENFSLKRRLWHIFINPKKLCARADSIITVSESTKNDLVDLYKIAPQKIRVISSGVAEKFTVLNRNDEKLIKVKEKYKLPYKFILYLGTIEPRKNIIGILRSYQQLQRDGAADANQKELLNYKLVIAGSKGWLSRKIFSEVEKSEFRDNIKVINFVEDADKEFVYNLASLFIYPSFFEGFGFPVLEAMRCGVPVITSNVSSLPEIVGSGAIMVDPDKPGEIAEAIKDLLTNKKIREDLVKKGFERAEFFSWQKTAKEFLKSTQELVKKQ